MVSSSDNAQAGPPRDGISGALARNVGFLKSRLSRKRFQAKKDTDFSILAIGIGGAIAVVLIVLAARFLDAPVSEALTALGAEPRAFFRSVTRFGKSEWFLVPAGLVGIGIFLADWRLVSRRLAAAWSEVGQLAGFVFISVAGAGILSTLVKCVIGRARPRHADGILDFSPITFDYPHLSFPSGHATTVAAAFMAIALITRFRPPLIGLLAVLAITTAGSRVMLGVHFTSDVLAGLFIGAGFAYFSAHWLGRRRLAFQRQPNGSLAPKTVAIRAIARRGNPFFTRHAEETRKPQTAKLHTAGM